MECEDCKKHGAYYRLAQKTYLCDDCSEKRYKLSKTQGRK